MINKTTKQGCAGNCAGKSSNNGFKTPTFQRVKDSKGKPIRGVWIRGKQFYARLFIDNGSGQKIDRRVPLEAKTVQDARRELGLLQGIGILACWTLNSMILSFSEASSGGSINKFSSSSFKLMVKRQHGIK